MIIRELGFKPYPKFPDWYLSTYIASATELELLFHCRNGDDIHGVHVSCDRYHYRIHQFKVLERPFAYGSKYMSRHRFLGERTRSENSGFFASYEHWDRLVHVLRLILTDITFTLTENNYARSPGPGLDLYQALRRAFPDLDFGIHTRRDMGNAALTWYIARMRELTGENPSIQESVITLESLRRYDDLPF